MNKTELFARISAVALRASLVAVAAFAGCGDDGGKATDAPPVKIDAAIDAPILSPAVLTIAPLTNDFGSIVQGQTSAAASFTVTNTGQSASGTISASVMGSAASDFNIESNGCSSTLAAAATCMITVSFTPDTTAGQKTATLSVSASPGGSATSSLNGISVPVGQLQIQSSTGTAFGQVVVGHTSTGVATITIVNTGGTTSGTLATVFGGADPGEFTSVSDGCNNQTLAANATCVITASFTPTAPGTDSASVTVSGNPGGSISATLTGSAVNDAQIQVTPSPSDFGSVVIGATSGTTTFTATNIGGVATGMIVPANVTGVDAANFVVVDSTCDGITLQPAASCGVTVRFAPASAGNKAATLVISGTPGGNGNATMLGNGIPPGQLTITAAVPFADTTVGQVSASQTLTVTNTGGSSTGALTTALGGADPSQFIIVAGSNGCQGVVLAANGQCTIAIQFAPTGAGGPQSANITVSGTPGGTVSSGLQGNGIPPALLSINPGSKDFGSIGTNEETAFQTFTVTNVGGQNSGIPNVSLGGADASQFNLVNNCSAALIPNATCSIQVRFAPTINGDDIASLDVTAAPGGTVSAGLHGAGVNPAQINSNGTSSINFPLTLVGDSSAPKGFTVINGGTETTGTIAITTTGANPNDYSVTNTCTTLSMGAQCSVSVVFSPLATGARNATVNVTATPGGSFTVALSGPALPRLQITSPALNPFDFGNVVVNVTSPPTLPVTVTNNTATTQTITTTPPAGGQYSIVSNGCTNLLSGDSCTVVVNFKPTSTGVKNANLTLAIGAGVNNQAVQGLTGTGVDSLNIKAVTVTDFGQVAVGTSSSALSFTVNNPTNSPTTGAIETTLTGTQFAVVTDQCSGKTLAGGNNCTITVIFLPTVTGAASTTLTVKGNPGGSAPITLTGQGVSPANLQLSVATLAFGNVFSGENSTKAITVTNPAGAAVTGTISTSIVPGAGVFTLVQGAAGDCIGPGGGITLAAGATCSVRVKFAPTGVTFGAEPAATVSIAANPGGGTKTVSVTGNSVSTISVAPATFDFGSRAIGTTTNKAFTVTNNSNNTVTVNTSTLLPADPDVTIIANTCSSVIAGGTCTVTVRFAPSAAGDTPVETLSTNSANGISTATITGHGLSAASVNWTETFPAGTPFDFGSTLNGEDGFVRTFNLTNLGETATGNITAITNTGTANFTVTADTCTGHSIAPAGSCAVTVQFTPAGSVSTNDVTASFTPTGTTNGTNATINVIGRQMLSGSLIFTPTIASYGSEVQGGTTATQTFTVQNTGLVSQNFNTGVVFSKTDVSTTVTPNWTTTSASTCGGGVITTLGNGGTAIFNVNLAAGDSCTIVVDFTPTTAGALQGFLLALVNGDPNTIPVDPYAPLTGTGLTQANVAVSSTAIDFGDVAVGASPSPTQTVTLTNNGQVASGAIATGVLAGADVSQFTILSNACTGALAAAASCNIVLQFHPSTVGNKAAHFTLQATPGLAGTTVNLAGNGVTQATIGVSPSTVQNAGSRAVGANDPGGTTFTVTNGGDVATGPLSIVLSNNTDYAVSGGSCTAGVAMPANTTCTVIVSFDPLTVGTDTTTVTVSANPGSSDQGSITGIGVLAFSINPNPADLGTVAVAGVGGDVAITFTNNADNATGLLEPVVLAGANANEVSVTNDGCAGQVVPAHGNCVVTVVLVPSSTGAKAATLTVTGGFGGPAIANLTGTGD